MVISNSWANEANAVFRRRALFGFERHAFYKHIEEGGKIYRHTLAVPTASADDVALLAAEKKDWATIRKRLQRSGALFRWFGTMTAAGAERVIYSSEPAFDGAGPLSDPVAALLETLRATTALRDPYPRRRAHDGPDGPWKPTKVQNGKWATMGTRPSYALLEMRQDAHDVAAAAANNVNTWKATPEELANRAAETIERTRHWAVLSAAPTETLFQLWESVGFDLSKKRWESLFPNGVPAPKETERSGVS